MICQSGYFVGTSSRSTPSTDTPSACCHCGRGRTLYESDGHCGMGEANVEPPERLIFIVIGEILSTLAAKHSVFSFFSLQIVAHG